jgi:hypothetical protein
MGRYSELHQLLKFGEIVHVCSNMRFACVNFIPDQLIVREPKRVLIEQPAGWSQQYGGTDALNDKSFKMPDFEVVN